MKRGRISAEDRARARLLDLWQRRPKFGDPVGCVTTTYTFDAAFFEEQCLGRFLGMETDPIEEPRDYLIEREEKLSQSFAAVAVDQAHVPKQRSLRWRLFTVRVPNGGIMHAKLTLLVWQHRIRVLIGSANLTEPGYRSNFENLAALDFGPEGGIPRSLLLEAIEYLEELRAFMPGASAEKGPQEALRRFLAGARRRAKAWPEGAWPRGGPSASIVPIGPRPNGIPRPHLFAQLGELWKFPPPDKVTIMSPFFDEGDRAVEVTQHLEAMLLQRGECELRFVVSGVRLPDDVIQLDAPEALRTPRRDRDTHRFYLVTPEPDESSRRLHAKSLWLERDQHALHCIGSSNFTVAGTGARTKGPVNFEINLAYLLPDQTDDLGRVCAHAYPPCEEVLLDESEVKFLPQGDRTIEAEGDSVLPWSLGAAIWIPGPPARLQLELQASPPEGLSIQTEDGSRIATGATWTAPPPVLAEVPWLTANPPSYLVVHWVTTDGPRAATWPVNVSDPRLLPQPEELRALSLDDLVEILASARPSYQVLHRLRKRRAERAAKCDGPETDPHKKVDTHHFLLGRMRRIAAALEEIRDRLARPVFSREALAWRLQGPFGPLALGERIAIEEKAAASFFLAEIALAVKSVKLEVEGDLSKSEAEGLRQEVLTRLGVLARAHPSPPNLAAYVDETFRELQP